MGVGNLAHFMYKIALFHQQQGAQTEAGGLSPLATVTLTTGFGPFILFVCESLKIQLNAGMTKPVIDCRKAFQCCCDNCRRRSDGVLTV